MSEGKLRTRIVEWSLVLVSIGFALFVIEAGYRAYLYYTFVVKTDYRVIIVNAKPRTVNFEAPGNIFGPNPVSTVFNSVHYNVRNEPIYRHNIRTNNLGWTSRYDYSTEKLEGEFRIAVIGGSTTAANTNELAWTDVMQDQLNADSELLASLGIKKISVVNIAFVGAGIRHIAATAGTIAARFSPDLTVANFSVDNLFPGGGPQKFVAPAQVQATVANNTSAMLNPVKGRAGVELLNGIEIPLSCSQGTASIANPHCDVSSVWYVPPGPERSSDEIAEAKRTVAWRKILHSVLLSPRPLSLIEVMRRSPISSAQAGALNFTEPQLVAVGSALDGFRFVLRSHPRLLLAHNPQVWHEDAPYSFLIDELITQLRSGGLDIERMSEHLPARTRTREASEWFTYDGHWSDAGAQAYGAAMSKVVRGRLLAKPSSLPSDRDTRCGQSFELYRSGRLALSRNELSVAERELDAALARLPTDNPEHVETNRRVLAACDFVGDLYAERAVLSELRGDFGAAEARWNQAFRWAAGSITPYQRRLALRLARGDDRGAIEDYSELIRLAPDVPQNYILRGDLRLKNQDGPGALSDFEAALKYGSSDGPLRFRLSQARWLAKDYAGVVTETTAGLAHLPDNAGLIFLRGSAKEQLGQLNEALVDFSAAVKLAPNDTYTASRARVQNRLAQNGSKN